MKVIKWKLISKTKFVDSCYEKFVNNPDSNDMNNTTAKKKQNDIKNNLNKIVFLSAIIFVCFQ